MTFVANCRYLKKLTVEVQLSTRVLSCGNRFCMMSAMRTMFLRTVLIASLIAGLTGVSGAIDDDQSWDVLRKLTHHSTIYFWLKSSPACVEGQLRKVTDSSVEVEISGGQNVTLQRRDILKVGDYLMPDFNFLYVARNSWLDVMALHAVNGTQERVRVATRNGKKHEGEVAKVSETEITLKQYKKEKKFARADVATVDYVRYKPPTDKGAFFMSEGVLLTPETWVYVSGLQPKVGVRVFDATKPEDNQEIKCDVRK